MIEGRLAELLNVHLIIESQYLKLKDEKGNMRNMNSSKNVSAHYGPWYYLWYQKDGTHFRNQATVYNVILCYNFKRSHSMTKAKYLILSISKLQNMPTMMTYDKKYHIICMYLHISSINPNIADYPQQAGVENSI